MSAAASAPPMRSPWITGVSVVGLSLSLLPCAVLLLLVGVGVVLILHDPGQIIAEMVEDRLLPADVKLGWGRAVLVAMVDDVLVMFLWLFTVINALRMFLGFFRGVVLDRRAARRIRGIGLGIVLVSPGGKLFTAAATLLATGAPPPLHRVVSGESLLGMAIFMLTGLALIVIGAAVAEAARLSAENAEFV